MQEEGPKDGIAILANSDQSDIPDESVDIIVDMFRTVGDDYTVQVCKTRDVYYILQ